MSNVIAEARASGRTLLNEVEAKALLAAAGVPVTETRLARTATEAVAAAEALGYPVALKIVSADIAHKSDVGLGGVFVEVLKDVAFRIVPLEPRDAAQMVREIRGFPILQGVRGQPPADLAALERLILKVSAFVAAHPEVAELDLNPVFAYAKGAIAADARIVLAEA